MMKKDDREKTMAWNIKALWVLIFAFAIMAIISSCSRKVVSTVERDTLTVVRIDTFLKERVRTEKVKEYIDRWNDRLVTINLQGDTLKDVRKERVYIEKDTHLRDTVAHYKSKYDSLRAARNHNTVKTVEVKPPLKQRIGEALMWMIIGAAIIVAARIWTRR